MRIIVAGGSSGGITGSGTDNTIPLWNGTSSLDNSSIAESSTKITSTKDILVNDDNGIEINNTAGTATQKILIKAFNESASTPNIQSYRHLVLECNENNSNTHMVFKDYIYYFMWGNQSGLLVTNASSFSGKSASAQLQVDSTTRGFLPPRMTTTQKNNISSPATGLVVYDTTLNKLCVYTGSAWETITSS